VVRIQSGSPNLLRSGRYSANYNANTQAATGNAAADAGVVLHNISAAQLQDSMSVRKNPNETVTYLPQSLIDNTNAVFEINGKHLPISTRMRLILVRPRLAN
jgi:hypothetical protein